MLMAHAFAYQEEVLYGGACIESNHSVPYLTDQTKLIQMLGLGEELPFACPTDRHGMIRKREDYFVLDTDVFSKNWKMYIESRMDIGERETTKSPGDPLQVNVHIRRGDVTPCSRSATEPQRYLPNAYYLALIDDYVPKIAKGRPLNITIYSETHSYESWDVFRDRGYRLALGTDVAQTWRSFLTADVLILSKSSFSLVPAIFNPNVIIYTPFWHKPLPEWTVVPKSMVQFHTKGMEDDCPK